MVMAEAMLKRHSRGLIHKRLILMAMGCLTQKDPAPLTRDTLPDWSLPVALAASMVIAFVICLLSWRETRRSHKRLEYILSEKPS